MTESPEQPANSDVQGNPDLTKGALPEELPPVTPPSAGYIVQLFLIPAMIVVAVIGVWALFGKLAETKTDWEQLVVELGSSNEHRRWRAALGLAHVLRNQQLVADASGEEVAEQPEVAAALSDLLKESLAAESTLDDDIKHQEFLARTLGALKADDVVLPVLADALSADHTMEVRKSSLMSLAMIAGRHFETQAGKPTAETSETKTPATENGDEIPAAEIVVSLDAPLDAPTITNEAALKQLRLAAQDQEPSLRHLAGYVLALVSGPDSIKQLNVMLLDGDAMARANAAVGLARNGDPSGVPVMINLLKEGLAEVDKTDFQKLSQEEQKKLLAARQFEQPVILSNCLKAIDSLDDHLTPEQRQEAMTVIEQISKDYVAANVRMQARSMVNKQNK